MSVEHQCNLSVLFMQIQNLATLSWLLWLWRKNLTVSKDVTNLWHRNFALADTIILWIATYFHNECYAQNAVGNVIQHLKKKKKSLTLKRCMLLEFGFLCQKLCTKRGFLWRPNGTQCRLYFYMAFNLFISFCLWYQQYDVFRHYYKVWRLLHKISHFLAQFEQSESMNDVIARYFSSFKLKI